MRYDGLGKAKVMDRRIIDLRIPIKARFVDAIATLDDNEITKEEMDKACAMPFNITPEDFAKICRDEDEEQIIQMCFASIIYNKIKKTRSCTNTSKKEDADEV